MGDNRLKILMEARGFLEKQDSAAPDRETLLKLIDILTTALERYSPNDISNTQGIARELINNQALLAMLKQQTDELDALKKLSINLTSSLDLPDVLDAVVSEAVRLIENARDVNIFLYRNYRLSFGAALDSDGVRNKPFSKPRSNGLTYTVARRGETIIVEDMRNHPLFAAAPKDWSGSIIGIPLKVGAAVVGVMNLSRLILGGFSHSELRLLGLL
ncbi:MAG TPA: GAF domain-containing protein, partial [Anaerolineales bacterium]|nr:GAF domain-containing protein [Anaerolineales bacterium]